MYNLRLLLIIAVGTTITKMTLITIHTTVATILRIRAVRPLELAPLISPRASACFAFNINREMQNKSDKNDHILIAGHCPLMITNWQSPLHKLYTY